jgi:hypothetical protein
MKSATLVLFGLLAAVWLPARATASDLYPSSSLTSPIPFQTQPMLEVGSTIPQRKSVPNDIDGDGLSELLLYSSHYNQLQIWTFALKNADESALQKTVLRTIDITGGYVVGAIGDLDADGKADLVFTSSRRDLYLWKSRGDGSFQPRSLGNYPEGWVLLGSADIDGDGTDDLLWHNPGTCQFAYWAFRKGVRSSSGTFPVDCGYQPVAIGYYSLSNQASIIWTDAAHELLVWDGVPGGGFNHASLGTYPGNETVYRLGGGDQGGGMSLLTVSTDFSGFSHRDFTRVSSIDGIQRSWARGTFGDGGWLAEVISGGYMVRAQGFADTAPIDFHTRSVRYGTPASVFVCVPSRQAYDDYLLQANRTCAQFDVDDYWYPVGSGVALGKLPPGT